MNRPVPEWLKEELEAVDPEVGFPRARLKVDGACYDSHAKIIIHMPSHSPEIVAERMADWRDWRAGMWNEVLPERHRG